MIDEKYLSNDNTTPCASLNKKVFLTKREITEEEYFSMTKQLQAELNPQEELDIKDIKDMEEIEDMDDYNNTNFIMKHEDPEIGKTDQVPPLSSSRTEINELESISPLDDYLNKNFEDVYLNEGRGNNVDSYQTRALPNSGYIQQDDQVYQPMIETNFDRNEMKLRILQEKIQTKVKAEYEKKIKLKETEIQMKAEEKFSEALSDYKDRIESKLVNEKQKLEDDVKKTWEDKYEDLLIECKSKLREDKEKQLVKRMYQKLKPSIEKEIYQLEYENIVEKIRREIEDKVHREITQKKLEEIDKAKKKLEHYTKSKLLEMEKEIQSKCKEDMSKEIESEVLKRDKEIKVSYLKKFENLKTNLEKQMKEEFEVKRKEMLKEIEEMKANIFRQKCAEKLKMNKLNAIKKDLVDKEKLQLEKAEKMEKVLTSISRIGSAMNKSYVSNRQDKSIILQENNLKKQPKTCKGKSEPDANDYIKQERNKQITVNESIAVDNFKVEDDPQLKGRTVNLSEINKRIKPIERKEALTPSPILSQESEYLFSRGNTFNTTKENYKYDEPEKLNKTRELSPSNGISNAITTNNLVTITGNTGNLVACPKSPCLSLQICPNVPESLSEFGKFLVKYIEKEENYKILYDKELKKMKKQVMEIFRRENYSDHCLTDYYIELADKLDVSYESRYKMLTKLLKGTAADNYRLLDIETEHMTDYFQKGKEIFDLIKNREKLKLRLQQKANKNELLLDDKQKFGLISTELEKKIKAAQEKFGISIIWKGLKYEWLMNFENWFYKNNK